MTMPHALRIIALCLVFFSGAAFAEDPKPAEPDPARVAAARDLLEVTGVTKQMDGMAQAMTRGFAKGANASSSEAGKKMSDQFDESMKKLLAYQDQMITDFANLYAETFTAEEMKAVADFYRSGPGAKFVAKTPELMKKGAEIGMKYSNKIAEEMKAQQAPQPAPQ
ncbi:DUF2059 domain-containing protein [Hyphomicrobium sp.]|uniref:DUF2059 domain-containing protein n=1 Tax=Hyphomicrobium sp. TaxID=82 RepID=UPI002D77A722|nr:DUF2059 domain-containing protein [Hyphomicrobium sp.]HET6390866.1 DUF2059 domain-containing protein [Hyphomicrobium sp.]